MRRPVIAGNWKLHKTIAETRELALALKSDLAELSDIDIVIAPPFTALSTAAAALAGSGIAVAAQNCYPVASGAFTGEVSPPLLREAGCRYVLVGHSERRQIFGESDAFINAKVAAVLAEGLQPILCIGETLAEREAEQMYEVLTRQLKQGLSGIERAAMGQVIIAYEPVWAIGTGVTASNEQAAEAHAFIRGLLQGVYDEETAKAMRILYGGSVKPDNVDGLMAQEDIDGTLVGGASLKAADFIRIARFQRS
ncbi:MAG: triose-phosphate isomerase [Trichloromonadaceae bacterium]